MIRRRPACPAGRHRNGQASTTSPRRSWDSHARADADRLNRAWAGWAVLYGTGSRRFHAIAARPLLEPLILSDHTPEGLEAQMREAEMAAIIRHEHETPVSTPNGPRLP